MICASHHSSGVDRLLNCLRMGVKYYTHFLMNEQLASVSEFTGVVELNRVPKSAGDLEDIAAILARSLEIDANDIRILHWSRLH
jgi:hypothetical protein